MNGFGGAGMGTGGMSTAGMITSGIGKAANSFNAANKPAGMATGAPGVPDNLDDIAEQLRNLIARNRQSEQQKVTPQGLRVNNY